MRWAGCYLAMLAVVIAFGGRAWGAAQITVDVTQRVRAVNPLIYGSQVSATAEYDQDIKDFVGWTELEFMRLWGGSGGDFHWDAPREQPGSRYPFGGAGPGGDLNQSLWADTDETLDWFDSIGFPGDQLMITVPATDFSPEEAAAWVRHVNAERGEGVVYWVVGGEPWGDWDPATQPPEDYAALLHSYAAAMKAVDPNLKLVASVGGGYWDAITGWDRTVIRLAGEVIDGLCYHWYPGMQLDYSDPAAAALWINGNILCFKPAVMERYAQLIAEEAPDRAGKIELGIGEVDGGSGAPTSDPGPSYYQDVVQWGVGDTLFWASYLGTAQQEGLAFSAQFDLQECPLGLIRGWSVWAGWGGYEWDNVTIRGKAYAMKLFSEHFRGTVVSTAVSGSDTFYKPVQGRYETYEGDVPYMDAYAALNPEGSLCVMVINRHPTEARAATLSIGGYTVNSTATRYDLGGASSSILAQNDWELGNPSGEIGITESSFAASNPFTYDFPAHSCTALVFSGTADPVAPRAGFSCSPRIGFLPVTVAFRDESLGSPTSWWWDFGDGSTSAEQHPTHEYACAGIYPVSLTVTNASGADTETKGEGVIATFRDVPAAHWALPAIGACQRGGIVGGYGDGTYRPEVAVTRDQMAAFVSRALAGGEANVPAGPDTATFADVPTDHWAFRYVEDAVANNIVAGYPDGKYWPDLPVDRGQMAAFIARAIVTPHGETGMASYTPPATPSFPDVATDFWTFKHIEYLREQGIVGGYPDGWYHPEVVCARDQMAVFVARAFGY